MTKNDMDVLLFYLLFYKAVDELLKYSKNLNIEHLNVLYAIIDYHKTNHQGMDIETLMKKTYLSKRTLFYLVSHLYHENWIFKSYDANDQRRLRILPVEMYERKMKHLLLEIGELLENNYLKTSIKNMNYCKLTYLITIYKVLNKIEKSIKHYQLSLNDLLVLGIIWSNQNDISLKSINYFSRCQSININLVIKRLQQSGYILKERDVIDERRVCIKLNMSKKEEIHVILRHCSKMIKKELTL